MTQRPVLSTILALGLLLGASPSARAADAAAPSNPLLDAAARGATPPAPPTHLRLLPPRRTGGPSQAGGGTHYAQQGGNDRHPCPQAAPCRTINAALARMKGGDVLIVGDGTYDEFISDNGFPAGYRGTPPPSGSAGAYTTIKAARKHGAAIQPRRGGPDHKAPILLGVQDSHHIQIEGFVVDLNYKETPNLGHCASTNEKARDLRFVDIDCKNGGQGFMGYGRNIEYIRVWSHNHGYARDGTGNCTGGSEPADGFCHGFYLQSGPPGSFRITESRLSDNNGYGFQSYQTNVTLERNTFEGNKSGGAIIVGPGGTIRQNAFPGQANQIQCTGCQQENNR